MKIISKSKNNYPDFDIATAFENSFFYRFLFENEKQKMAISSHLI